jgi:gas vesicle protein
MSLDAGAIAFSTKLVTAHAAGNNAGSELAQLKTRLTSLMKLAKDMSGDGSLDVKAKKELQKMLQAEIQMLMQRIAELESAGQKGGAQAAQGDGVKGLLQNISHTAIRTPAVREGGIDTFA